MTNLDNLKYVNQPIMKSDAMSLVTGKPVYLDDVAPKDCLDCKSFTQSSCQCYH